MKRLLKVTAVILGFLLLLILVHLLLPTRSSPVLAFDDPYHTSHLAASVECNMAATGANPRKASWTEGRQA